MDRSELIEVVKVFNEAGLCEPIRLTSNFADLKEDFMSAIEEIVASGGGDEIPDSVVIANNTLVEEAEEKNTTAKNKPISKEAPVEKNPLQTPILNQKMQELLPKEEVTKKPAAKAKEAPVEKKPTPKEAPVEKKPTPKEVITKPAPKEEIKKKIPVTTKIMMIVVDNPQVTVDDIRVILKKEGYKVSDGTLALQKNDTLKTVEYIRLKNESK